jgi:hypothetical protein
MSTTIIGIGGGFNENALQVLVSFIKEAIR